MPSFGTFEERFPELFCQTDVDPRMRHRDRPMKLLILGMSRTGTKSMKAALEELGIREVYHMSSAMRNPKDCIMWQDALNAKFHNKGSKFTRKDWDQLLGNCEACIDLPAAAFMPELIEAYPDAKVIVAMRDPDKWYQSWSNTVGKRAASWHIILLSLLDPFFLGKLVPMTGTLTSGLFGAETAKDPEHVKAVYVRMYEEVRRMVPQDKLFEYKLGDGWEPLCKFLNKDVPTTTFPFINESKEFMECIDVMERVTTKRVAFNVLYGVSMASILGLALCSAVSLGLVGLRATAGQKREIWRMITTLAFRTEGSAR